MSSKASTSTLKVGGNHNKKHRNTRKHMRRTRQNKPIFNSSVKFQRFKKITDRRLPKKGIVYSIEKPEVISRDNTIDGDIIKKYVNGKLVGQKFVTKNKILEMSQNYKKLLFGGAVAPIPQKTDEVRPAEPVVVRVQDDTSFFQSFKTGLGFALAFEFIGRLFGDN